MSRMHSVTSRLAIQLFGIMAGTALCLAGARSAFSQTTPNTLYNFTSGFSTGQYPAGTLTQDSHGVLYGVTAGGGVNSEGTVFKMTTAGAVTTIFSFTSASNGPYHPFGQLAVDSSGNIYGTCRSGGSGSDGAVYKLSPTGSPPTYSLTVLHAFTGYNSSTPSLSDGSYPSGGVYLNSNVLYGTTQNGGTHQDGTVWSYNISSPAYALLYNFVTISSQDGTNPQTAPIIGSDGRLYGVTYYGGVNSVGTIYSMKTDGSTYDNYSFTGIGSSATGSNPVGRLVQTGGAFYGMCNSGANVNAGNVFKFTHSGSTYTVSSYLSFDGYYGAYPFNRLAVDSGGNLYGFTTGGGIYGYGTAFKLPTTGINPGIPVRLHSFNGVDGQFNPSYGQPGPYLAADKKLYGVSSGGGLTATLANSYTGGYGAAFNLTSTGGFTSLASFYVQGFYNTQIGSVVQAPDGNFYGDASDGGAYGNGALYRSDAAGNVSTVHNFFNSTDGYSPETTPTLGQDGALYGQTYSGGLLGYGTIWRCTTSGAFSIVRNLDSQDGDDGAPMFQAANKTFYGTMENGGVLGYGTAFSCTTSGVYTILHNFGYYSPEGYYTQGIYYQDSSGYLYGICRYGGTTSYGSLWKMKADGSSFTILHGFVSGSDGYYANSMIAVGTTLYGCCFYGGPNSYGTVWSYNTGSNTFSVLNSFSNTNGYGPTCLLLGPDGNLYGTTTYGGGSGGGELFEISPVSPYTINPLYSLNGGSDGSFPQSKNLTLGSDGYFYTATIGGGLYGWGTILALNDTTLANAVNVTSKTSVSSVINVTAKTATVSIKNTGTTTLLGPIQLVVTGSSNPSGLGVTNATGTVPALYTGSGSPYLTVPSILPHNILSLGPGKTVKVVVHLSGAVTSSTTLSTLVYTGRF